MSDLRTAAQQALEALEWHLERGAWGADIEGVTVALRAALAQQEAPVELEQVDLSRCPQCNGPADNGHDRSIPPNTYLCTKCMAEPVASLMTHVQSGDVEVVWNDDGFDRELWHETPLYTAPPHCPNCASLEAQNDELDRKLAEMERAEPAAVVGTQVDVWRGCDGRWAPPGEPIKTALMLTDMPVGTMLYPAPPQRQPLTKEEIDRICASLGFAAISPAEIVRAVERAHGIGETK